MRVLILTQYFPPEIGAPQTRLAALARELRRRNHEVEVVTAMPHHLLGRTYIGYRGKLYDCEPWEGINVHRTWVYAATGTGFGRILNYLSFTLSSFIGLLRAQRPDVVFVESPPLFLGVPGWLAALKFSAKLVFNVADLWPDSVRELGVIRDGPILRAAEHLEAWTYRHADAVNAVTDGIRETLVTRKGVPPPKIHFLPNGIDVNEFAPRKRDESLAKTLDLDARPVFIYAGTHGIAQGLHHLVDAAKLVEREAILLFVGAGPTKPAIVERARRLAISNVRFVDMVPLERMPQYFSLSYASIVPLVRADITRGARPSKMFPALASGVPIVYSGEGEGARLVHEAGAGIVVPPENPVALAGAMCTLAYNPARRNEMAERARAVAVERFAWSSIVGDWLHSLTSKDVALT